MGAVEGFLYTVGLMEHSSGGGKIRQTGYCRLRHNLHTAHGRCCPRSGLYGS